MHRIISSSGIIYSNSFYCLLVHQHDIYWYLFNGKRKNIMASKCEVTDRFLIKMVWDQAPRTHMPRKISLKDVCLHFNKLSQCCQISKITPLWNLQARASAFISSRSPVSLSNTKEERFSALKHETNMHADGDWLQLHCGFLLLGRADDGKKEEYEAGPVERQGGKSSHRPTYSVTKRMRLLSRSPQRWACFHFF